jgi:hypothetical protein
MRASNFLHAGDRSGAPGGTGPRRNRGEQGTECRTALDDRQDGDSSGEDPRGPSDHADSPQRCDASHRGECDESSDRHAADDRPAAVPNQLGAAPEFLHREQQARRAEWPVAYLEVPAVEVPPTADPVPRGGQLGFHGRQALLGGDPLLAPGPARPPHRYPHTVHPVTAPQGQAAPQATAESGDRLEHVQKGCQQAPS